MAPAAPYSKLSEKKGGGGNHTSCSHASAGNKSKTPTLPWSGEEKYAFGRLDVTKDQPAGGAGGGGIVDISSWDFTEKKNNLKKKKRDDDEQLAAPPVTVIPEFSNGSNFSAMRNH